MTNHRYFQVSGKGNGIGITVLRLVGQENPIGPSTLTLHVLPKIWSDFSNHRQKWLVENPGRKSDEFILVRTLPDFASTEFEGIETWHSYLYEMDTLQLPLGWAKCLGAVSPNSPENTEEIQEAELILDHEEQRDEDQNEEETEDGEVDPLWQEVTLKESAYSEVQLEELRTDHAEFMWELLSYHNQNPSRVAGHKDFPPAGTELFPNIPAMREVFYTQFVRFALEAVRHRKPAFLPVQEELGFVRGRMVPRGLIDRKVKQRLPILCEFDALTTDSYIWQMIRAATQVVATSDNQVTLGQAVELDAHLRDVRLVSASLLLTDRVPSNELARLTPELKKAYFLGRAIISDHFGLGTEEPLTEGGVIANIKYTSSYLWESILASYMRQSIEQAEVQEQEKLYLYYKQRNPDGHRGKPKTPDIIVSKDQKRVVFDAKYKFPKYSITASGMGDQYQLTTYSYRMGCSAFLVYPQRVEVEKTESLKSNYLYLPPPGYGYQQDVEDIEEAWKKIGVLSLPFPSPGSSVTSSSLSREHREHISRFFDET